MRLIPTSALTADDVAWVRSFLAERPLFALYFQSALADLERGRDNRLVHLGLDRKGIILGIFFDGLVVLTAIGELRPQELELLAHTSMPTELHIELRHEAILAPLCKQRLLKTSELRIYRRDVRRVDADPTARLIDSREENLVRTFMRRHNPRTIFSSWMLELPFVGIEEGGELVATAGTIGRAGATAVIGNFLTRPDRRGQGLARRLALHLTWALCQQGIEEVLLATTSDNKSACRAYETAGFRVIETRRQ